jgi:acylglycerol lipase
MRSTLSLRPASAPVAPGLVIALAVVLTLGALSACARPDPGLRASLPQPPAGDGVSHAEVALEGTGGLRLYARRWTGSEPARGVLVVVHGLKDHSDRYATFAGALARAGYAVYALDLRGHGRSAGPRVTVDDFDHYVADVARLLAHAQAEHPGLPAFVFGHSMGGVIATTLAQTRRPALAGVILSAPAIGLDAPAFQAAGVVGIGATPGLGSLPLFEPNTPDFSSREEVVDEMARDPLIHNAGAPVRTAAELLGAMGRAWDRASRITMPILILHGTADRLTAPAASRDFLRRVATQDRTLLLYDGAWHDLVHEPAAPQITTDVQAWMDAHLTGPATAPALPTGRMLGDRVGLVERHHLRGGYVIDPEAGGDLDASLSFGVGRALMLLAALEGRVALAGPSNHAAYGTLGLGTRLGGAGWIALGGGGGWLGGDLVPAAQTQLVLAPQALPLALHARVTGFWADGGDLALGLSRVESELTLRWPGDRTFWGRGRHGTGLTLGARTFDGTDGLTILLGFEAGGHD